MLGSNISTQASPGAAWALKLLREAGEIAGGSTTPTPRASWRSRRGSAEFMVGHWKSALDEIDRAEAIFREQCTGVAWELDTCHVFTLMALADLGDFGELRRRWEAQRQGAQDRGDLYALTALDTQTGTHVRLAADDPEGARRAIQAVMAQWSREGFHLQHLLSLNAEMLVDLYQGEGASALARIEASRRKALPARSSSGRRSRASTWSTCGGSPPFRRRGAARDPRPLLQIARRAAGRLDRERVPWASAIAELIRAGILAVSGGPAAAARRYARAAELLDAVDMPHYAAAARRRQGEALGGEQGRALLIAPADLSLTRPRPSAIPSA